MQKISVIIVNWNVSDLVLRCIESMNNAKYSNLEIIIIDNASKDDDLINLMKVKNINLVLKNENLGFRKAVNIGFKIATGELIILLNPDTLVPQNFFSECLKFFKEFPDAGIMGPKFVNEDLSIQGSVFPDPSVINTIKQFWLNKGPLTEKYSPNTNDPVTVPNVSGGCMVMTRSVVEKLGLFPENAFMYYEDLDYCKRARNNGFKVYFNPRITIIHAHGRSASKSNKANKYLIEASKKYNGLFKYYAMWFVSWSGQKLRHVFER